MQHTSTFSFDHLVGAGEQRGDRLAADVGLLAKDQEAVGCSLDHGTNGVRCAGRGRQGKEHGGDGYCLLSSMKMGGSTRADPNRFNLPVTFMWSPALSRRSVKTTIFRKLTQPRPVARSTLSA